MTSTGGTPRDERTTFEPLPSIDAYEQWEKDEGVPVVGGFYIEDLNSMELAPWPRKGGRGAILNLEGTGGVNDAHVVEIRPGASSPPERHLYEAMVYVLSGRGATSVWYDPKKKQTFEWGAGSLFAIPLNAWYQHFNGSGSEPARYVAVTNLPSVLNMFHNREFVFNNAFAFTDRFAGMDGYFNGEGTLYRGGEGTRFRALFWETNFVPDLRTLPLHRHSERGGGSIAAMLELAQNSMGAHVSQFQVGTYKKAHRHGPGAHVIILDGVGFSLLWEGEDDERKRCDWKPGSVIVPPDNWFHQHFNTGNSSARYLALRFTGKKYRQPVERDGGDGADTSVKLGGWQIEYTDEDRSVHRMFEEELARHGAPCRMRPLIPWCAGA
jgi:quercetin dioxygenase-like cupin family protein/oxalate decarboxylase/phosphoglucose isomerase-like protein (cupin superfamily)